MLSQENYRYSDKTFDIYREDEEEEEKKEEVSDNENSEGKKGGRFQLKKRKKKSENLEKIEANNIGENQDNGEKEETEKIFEFDSPTFNELKNSNFREVITIVGKHSTKKRTKTLYFTNLINFVKIIFLLKISFFPHIEITHFFLIGFRGYFFNVFE